ncbi:uncharacterized protein TNCV_1564181 [Trichonephila clavipes]|nr:uncharacterized protein TNCV_1564181 [Trichonephila clavipes]
MSEDLSKLKKKRTAVRSSLTKWINKIEGMINNENEPVDQFEAFLEQLNNKERLGWDDKFPKQLEASWNKWCDEIQCLSEINIPRNYFQNFFPSNATTIQLHGFSNASKKTYGAVAYLRIQLNDGNIISSFVASKSRIVPLKTLSIPRLELMGALLSARIKEIQKLSDPKEWRYCKGKDNPADLISRGLPLNDLKNNKIWWHGPKWLTMKQTEWPLFSEPTIETEIDIDKLELKKSIKVNTTV